MCAGCASVLMEVAVLRMKGPDLFLVVLSLRDVGILLTPSSLRLESFKETGGTQDPHAEKSATMHC